jgi:hypothetical protein
MPPLIWNQYSVSFRENFPKGMVLEDGAQGSLGVVSDEYQPVSELVTILARVYQEKDKSGRTPVQPFNLDRT